MQNSLRAAQDQSVFLGRVAVGEPFAGRTDINVLLRHIPVAIAQPAIASRTASPEKGCQWGDEMNEQATKLETVESNLKQLMADVSRSMEKAQEAIARVTSTVGAATAGTESATKSR